MASEADFLQIRPPPMLPGEVVGCGNPLSSSFCLHGPDSSQQEDAPIEKLGTRDRVFPSLPWYWDAWDGHQAGIVTTWVQLVTAAQGVEAKVVMASSAM